MALVTKSAFARAKGVSPAAVTNAIKTGRIAAAIVLRNEREMIDSELAMALWDKNTLQQPPPVEPRRRQTLEASTDPPSDQQLRAFIQGLPEDQIPDLNDSRARREHYLAEKARLEALQGRKELLPADQVKDEAFALARAVRDGMLGIADRLAPLLAATTDARQVHQLLDQEIRVALRSLGNA